MPEPADISAKTGKDLRAVALMVVLCLLCAVGWSVAASAGQDGFKAAAVNPPVKAPPGAGSDSREGNPPPGKFYLPRQLFVEVSRTAPRDPPLPPQPTPLLPLPTDSAVVWERLAPAGTWRIQAPAEGVGWSTPRTPTGPPASI